MRVPFDGAALRAARTARGWTQERLGRELDVGLTAVTRWENGHHRPQPSTQRRLAALFPPAEPSPCAVWWRGVALPHAVVAVQVQRVTRWGGVRGEPEQAAAAREFWLLERDVARAADAAGGWPPEVIAAALDAALEAAWTRDQQTHPGESWCVEMDTADAQQRIGYVLTSPDVV